MEYPIKYHVVPNESFEAEGRIFLAGQIYPVYDRNGRSMLCAENGDFYFTNQLMKQVITEWDLAIQKT